MIKNIFLPEHIQNYYLFPKRIVGFHLSKTHVSATQIYLKGNKTFVEKYIEKRIETGSPADYEERAVKTIQEIASQLDRYDTLYTALSGSVVIFKELRLPFLSYEKINMVINFEVEPLLPFSIDDAVIDFIITKRNEEEKNSEVLVAAVQNRHMVEHLRLFDLAGLQPERVTVDLFALYGLYTKIPSYKNLLGGAALIDLGLQSTRIVYIYNGQLRFVRTLAKGVYHLAKAAGKVLDVPPGQVIEDMTRFGLEKPDDKKYSETIRESFTDFWNTIQFTLQSFTTQTTPKQTISKILLLGKAAQATGTTDFVTDLLNVPCELFQTTEIVRNNTIKLKNNIIIPSSGIISLSIALPSPTTQDFNLRKEQFTPADTGVFAKQLGTTCILILGVFTSLIINSSLQIKKFKKEAISSEQEAVATLKEQFKNIERDETNLEDVVELAQHEIVQEEEMWSAFSNQARSSFLKYLLELTSKIDKEGLGFNLESIEIAQNVITLKAEVKDHKALSMLEKTLRQSKLFKHVEGQDKTKFAMKILLAKNGEE